MEDGGQAQGLVLGVLSNHKPTPNAGLLPKGGYAYRLCKVGGGGIAGVTEECFQQGHLKFYGSDTWLLLLSKTKAVEVLATIKQPARRTTEGTTRL